MKKKILFVCTGNTCRSVLAQALFEKLAKEAGLDISISSAGTSVFPGSTIPVHIFRLLKGESVNQVKQQPEQLTSQMLKEADLILVMENFHLQYIHTMGIEAKDKTFLIKDYASLPGHIGIPDPIGSSWEGYETCFLEIKQALLRIVKRLKDEDSYRL